MPKLAPDDEINNAQVVFLGPPGYTFPWEWSYQQYGVTTVFAVPLFVACLALFNVVISLTLAIAIAALASSLLFRYVDPDRPIGKVLTTIATDWRSLRPPTEQQMPTRTAQHVRRSRP
jgi:hypothetical protein